MRNTRGLTMAVMAAVVVAAGAAGASGGRGRVVQGDSRIIGGARVSTWAVLDQSSAIQEVGVTIPLSVLERPPSEPGDGPAGALATLRFPNWHDETGFFDHFELHWNPGGHEPLCFKKAHFDFHFYMVPETVVRAIDRFEPETPSPDALPQGYIYAGEPAFHPQMGNHLFRPEVLQQPFTSVMIAGWNAGALHFLEPMVTQEHLLARRDFEVEVPPRPKSFTGTLYPSYARAKYDRQADAYHIVFGGFSQAPSLD